MPSRVRINVALSVIQANLGHSSLETTRVNSQKRKRTVINRVLSNLEFTVTPFQVLADVY